MDNSQYSHCDDFAKDVRLTFDNATTYNPEPSDVHQMAKTLLDNFEKRWEKLVQFSQKPPEALVPKHKPIYKDDLPGNTKQLYLPHRNPSHDRVSRHNHRYPHLSG